jgi:hypothetical protein
MMVMAFSLASRTLYAFQALIIGLTYVQLLHSEGQANKYNDLNFLNPVVYHD